MNLKRSVLRSVFFLLDFRCILILMLQPMLEIKNLRKVYDAGKEEKLAVDNISLTVERGAFFGLLGPNGAGKSTIIHCITGVAQPTSGEILVDGVDVVKQYKQARTKVGLSPQEFNLDFFAKVEDLLDYMGGYYGIPRAERKERIDELWTLKENIENCWAIKKTKETLITK